MDYHDDDGHQSVVQHFQHFKTIIAEICSLNFCLEIHRNKRNVRVLILFKRYCNIFINIPKC